ncbi:MAG: hypothetical protein FWC97_08790 [Treponema sp.]|nr:hypothetical protein [Treponema sp.]
MLKIGLVSAKFINNDIVNNTKNILKFMDIAKENDIDLIMFGESFLQGFECLNWKPEDDLLVGIQKYDKKIDVFRDHCNNNKIALGFGYIERDDKKLYSSYMIINKNGNILANYRRISNGWRIKDCDIKTYCEGEKFEIFEFMNHKMSIGICGDLWEDELIKIFPKNIDTLLWPNFRTDWEENEINLYIEHIKSICKNIFFVNSICEEEISKAIGGAFAIVENKLHSILELEKEGMLIVEY